MVVIGRHRSARGRWALLAAGLLAIGGLPAPVSAAGDLTPPVGAMEYWAIDNVTQLAELRFAYTDPESGLDHIKFICDGGPEHLVPYASTVFLPVHDGSAGCSTSYGTHELLAWVVNGDGLESLQQYAPVSNGPAMSMTVSAAPTTGQPITITPQLPDDFTIPAGAFCRWEFRWGTTQALDVTFTGDTFGGLLLDIPAASGGCGPWTFTLPWVPYRQFDVIVELGQIESDGGMALGPRAHARFTAAVGTTERRILASNLPIAQVLPSTYTPIVGQPITYTRYLVGGASACCNPRWVARLGTSETPKQWTQSGGSTFTFTPTGPGDLFVGWDRQATSGLLLAAYYDPPVRYRDTTAPNTTAPSARLGGGALGSTVPVTLTWTGTDRGWGIASYQLQQSIDGGTWTSVTLPSATSRTVVRQLSPGVTARYRVRARDRAGNVGTWDYGPTFKAVLVSDANRTLRYARTWIRRSDPSALGGSVRESIQSGASVTFTWGARDLAWVAERGPDHGKARVYIDGILIRTVDLYAASPQPRRMVFTRHFATLGTHTIRIVGLATAGRPTTSFDGLAVLR